MVKGHDDMIKVLRRAWQRLRRIAEVLRMLVGMIGEAREERKRYG